MKILALTVALLFAASPAAAQTSQTQQPLGAGGQTNNSSLTDTGVICQEEIVATFCNVTTSPNNGGYGTNGGAAGTRTGITTPSPAIPAVEKLSYLLTSCTTECLARAATSP
jgi:hypothetical protein